MAGIDRRGRASQGGADMIQIDGVALGEEQDFANDVFQLAHIARPVFGLEEVHRKGVNP